MGGNGSVYMQIKAAICEKWQPYSSLRSPPLFYAYGKMLMEHSFQSAIQSGYDTIVIFGSPVNYVSRGFKSCKKYNVCIESGKYPAAMMVKELRPHALDGHKWVYQDSPVMAISEEEAERYDAALEPMEKKHLPSQEEFYIMSRSFVEG